ncbi:MAG: hypothetical protein H6707_08535 [Deltaproteobacteria bacterium]|nr:hypothetical protein [Deltaproteobacteria bacterium]
MRFAWLTSAALAIAACRPIAREPLAYRFQQPLLGEQRPMRARVPRKQAMIRLRKLIGTPAPQSAEAADNELLRQFFGHPIKWQQLQLSRERDDAHSGALVVFENSRPLDRRPTDQRQVGIVLDRRQDAVSFVYASGGKFRLGLLDLRLPHRRRYQSGSSVANSYLRQKRREDPPETRYLAGELFAGFITP